MLELDDVKNIEDCYELVCMDVYDDAEMVGAWEACLADALDSLNTCKLFNEVVAFHGVTIKGKSVVAQLSKNNKEYYVCFESIKFVKATKVQKLWIKAYLAYQDR